MGEAIWRGYDRAALDRQLNLRARTPEHVEFFARWEAKGERTRQSFPGAKLDLPYGDAPAERLDLFPAGAGAAPLVAFIHGGYWQSLSKAQFAQFAPAFRDAGVAFASIEYTLAPHASIPHMVEQCRRALGFLHGNAAELGIDPGRLVVSGHSAGGHLAAMCLITEWDTRGLPRDLLAGGVSVSGIYDLEPLRLSYQQEVLQLDPDQVYEASPLRQVPDRAPPLLLAVGETEPEEFLDQQREMQARYAERRLIAHEIPLAGRHHFDAVEALAEPGHELHRRTVALAREGKAG
jgi:arylformamidase